MRPVAEASHISLLERYGEDPAVAIGWRREGAMEGAMEIF